MLMSLVSGIIEFGFLEQHADQVPPSGGYTNA